MSTNTIEENQRRCQLDASDQVWLFGYGSLIYLVDFLTLTRNLPALAAGVDASGRDLMIIAAPWPTLAA